MQALHDLVDIVDLQVVDVHAHPGVDRDVVGLAEEVRRATLHFVPALFGRLLALRKVLGVLE